MHTYSSAAAQPTWPQPFTCTACAGSGRTSDWLDSECCDWCQGAGLMYATPPSLADTPYVAWLECDGRFVTWLGSAAEADFWMFAPQSSVTCHYLPHDPSVVYDETGHDQRDELARFCDVCGFTWPPDERCPFH